MKLTLSHHRFAIPAGAVQTPGEKVLCYEHSETGKSNATPISLERPSERANQRATRFSVERHKRSGEHTRGPLERIRSQPPQREQILWIYLAMDLRGRAGNVLLV